MRGVNTAAVIVKSRIDLFLETEELWKRGCITELQVPHSSTENYSKTLEIAVTALAGRNVSGSLREHVPLSQLHSPMCFVP